MSENVVSSLKEEQLKERMESLGILEKDIIEKFILGSGKGGQKINKTASCVYLKHLLSGIEIKSQGDRSRALNRFFARRQLCDRVEELLLGKESERIQTFEKIKRQKRRRSRRSKQNILDNKHKISEKKQNRKNISSSHE
ncbi:MAG: peptide chain release factor-like protein [Candidatus Margulisiibacteriota bacterium]|nr:MAG: peptide chain release factor 1 [Candidatus Margulisbacteria bacterium GWD2_39_127]OGI05217.1 MAG: peptide chain release factor 1 [Candidatus Margulisbacteria bacterium GWF2_38_17]OGI06266.1 MAG: peptide chain release factor 1 [Candidatus Margulisbacteria bacterium GWE2_39_32]PZM78923.1 MAG: peptide chain release factor-like protein [Candidatus Margulisiibacteriota bacterium]HAR64493.1 peptide chain release factor-like protein [Candidatus Margulisiibacteriota bacterium]